MVFTVPEGGEEVHEDSLLLKYIVGVERLPNNKGKI